MSEKGFSTLPCGCESFCYPGSLFRGLQSWTFRVREGRSSLHNSTSALEWISYNFKHAFVCPQMTSSGDFFILNLFYLFIIVSKNKNLTLMELIIVIAVYCLVLHLLFITRKSMKTSNPHYSLFDDILLWTGIPFAFGYFLYVVINPENQSKFVYQVINETSYLMIPLYSWMLISGLLFAWRNRKSRRLY